MPATFKDYNAIKQLLLKYKLEFKDHKDYENYIKDLLEILEL